MAGVGAGGLWGSLQPNCSVILAVPLDSRDFVTHLTFLGAYNWWILEGKEMELLPPNPSQMEPGIATLV